MADGPTSVPKQDVGIGNTSVQGIAEGVADAATKLAHVALGKTEDSETSAQKMTKEAPGGGKKKDPKADKKAERMAKREAQAAAAKAGTSEADPLADNYGDMPTVQSRSISGQKWTPVRTLTSALDKQEILIRGRVHTVRAKGKSAFLVVREGGATVQVVFFVDEQTVSKQMVKYISGLSKESIVDVWGVVSVPPEALTSTTQQVELNGRKIYAVNKATPHLPISVEDAARSEQQITEGEAKGEKYVRVSQDTRLNNRSIDLRTPANQGIFRIQSQVSQLFREYLLAQKFVEIHTPKLISGSSEGGASVFHLQYLGQPACLAQSPQLYKQMAIMADFGRVFEVGPVFRAEKSFTHRHLTEFTGLDFEMEIKEHYNEVLDVIDGLFVSIFEGINTRCKEELEAINSQYPFEPLQFLPHGCRIKFADGIQLLHEAGFKDADPHGDLSTELERELGKLVKEKYHTDFYILTDFPIEARPFYTMPSPTDPRYTNSFDVFIRGEEIISGAQRIHEPELLTKRATECGIDVKTISAYIDAFKYGAVPHGGAGVGLERVVMLFLALNNIRKTSMFPRDPQRLTP